MSNSRQEGRGISGRFSVELVMASLTFIVPGGMRRRTGTPFVAQALSQSFAQLHASLVKLRFGVAHGTVHDLGDFIVFVALYVVRHADRPVAGRKFGPPLGQVDG